MVAWPTSLGLDLGRLLARQVRTPCFGSKENLHRTASPSVVDELVGVDARSLHVPVARRDAPGALHPGHHVQRFRVMHDEVVEAPGLLPVRHRVGLEGVDHVRELDRVADEEDLEVVADEVPVAVDRLELDREAARVARRLGRVLGADHGREADEDGRAHAGLRQHLGAGVFRGRLVADLAVGLEIAVRGGAAGVDDALGDALAVEMRDLLDELVVLEGRRAALADASAGSGCPRPDGPAASSGSCDRRSWWLLVEFAVAGVRRIGGS